MFSNFLKEKNCISKIYSPLNTIHHQASIIPNKPVVQTTKFKVLNSLAFLLLVSVSFFTLPYENQRPQILARNRLEKKQ